MSDNNYPNLSCTLQGQISKETLSRRLENPRQMASGAVGVGDISARLEDHLFLVNNSDAIEHLSLADEAELVLQAVEGAGKSVSGREDSLSAGPMEPSALAPKNCSVLDGMQMSAYADDFI